jgi:hypothetical protein
VVWQYAGALSNYGVTLSIDGASGSSAFAMERFDIYVLEASEAVSQSRSV